MASWTAPSTISGSVWDGPSGCPIVSPSNWTNQVLSNLCVLSVHNHSGSAGEGVAFAASLFPAIDNDQFSPFFPTASTNWSRGNDPGGINYLLSGNVSTSTQNATISYDIYLRDGTYQVNCFSSSGSAMGIITACVNGASVASMDRYQSGTEAAGQTSASFSFTASGYGERQLTFAIDTKNGSSNGYVARLHGPISIRRTGA